MTIPRVFSGSREQNITSYSYTDIDEGFGYVNYSGFIAESPAADYLMTRQLNFTSKMQVNVGAGGNIDVDTPIFNITKNISGNAVFQVSYELTNAAASDNARPTITLYKYNATDGEVAMSSTISGPLLSGSGAGIQTDRTATIYVPLTDTKIKKGDIIRATIGNTGNNTMVMNMSPYNLGTTVTNANHTKFIIAIPSKLIL